MKLPKHKLIANLPTPIQSLNMYSEVFIKRDDFTGFEMSGNKIRKLGFIVPIIKDKKNDVLITCGGVQSNHCRATAALAAKLGIKSHLILAGEKLSDDGNCFLDLMFGAKIKLISPIDYKQSRMEIMNEVSREYIKNGYNPVIIPEGASNGIGMFGYYHAMLEIVKQEEEMGIAFDNICLAVGSGGTYSGLFLANEILGLGKRIIGFNIYDKDRDFKELIRELINEGLKESDNESYIDKIDDSNILIIHDYLMGGYGKIDENAIEFIKGFTRSEGILLDPTYTGKAFFGLSNELRLKNSLFEGKTLFIHTGGQFGALSRVSEMLY